jgi:hypothetical protein
MRWRGPGRGLDRSGLEGQGKVRELERTNDAVRLSWIEALLRSAGIQLIVLDSHASLVDGSIGAVPRRVMVADADLVQAQALLDEAGKFMANGANQGSIDS